MTLFAGFADLDQWIRNIDRARPVYALSLAETHHSNNAHATQVTHVTLSQPTADGSTVNYIRIRTARRNFVGGQPWDDTPGSAGASTERHQKAITAWHNTLAYLAENDVDSIPAAIARPTDLALLEAHAGTIPDGYDLSTMTCYNCHSADVEAAKAEAAMVHLRCHKCGEETAWLPIVAKRAVPAAPAQVIGDL